MSENVEEIVIDPNTDNLDDFNKLITGSAKAGVPEEAKVDDEIEEESVDNLATENDNDEEDETDVDDDHKDSDEEDEDHDDDDESDEKDENVETSKKDKQSRFQKKINDLTAKRREAERKAEGLEEKLNQILQKLDSENKNKPESKETKEQAKVEFKAPSIDDKNEDGTDKYALGEFDPKYIADLTKFTIAKEMEEQRELLRKESEQAKVEEEKQVLNQEWQGKLANFTTENPEVNLQEVGDSLENALQGIEPTYAQYLEDVIKSMEAGVEVLCYLGQNTEEAKKIVAMGPAKATIQLGRLESLFLDSKSEEKPKTKTVKLSNAPEPPLVVNKGTKGLNVSKIRPDTDDLDAFSKLLYKE